MAGVLTLPDLYRQAGATASSATSAPGRAALFRRALGSTGLSGLRAAGINTDDDDEMGAAAILGARGRLAGAGADPGRWTKDPQSWGGEEFSLGARQSTASGSTGAVITVTGELEIDLDDAVLLLHDPTGHIVGNGGYWSAVQINKRELILGASSSEWKPCDADDLSVLVGEGQGEAGGIYLGNLVREDAFSVGVFIPTSSGTVDWGLVVRGTPKQSSRGYNLLQGGSLSRARFIR